MPAWSSGLAGPKAVVGEDRDDRQGGEHDDRDDGTRWSHAARLSRPGAASFGGAVSLECRRRGYDCAVKVAVCVAAAAVPAWQHAAVAALRRVQGVQVRVVVAEARPWKAPRGALAWIAGPALAPATVQIDDPPAAGGADLVLDLTGGAAVPGAPHGVWSFRLGADDDADLPFAREVVERAEIGEIALVRRGGPGDAILRSGRFGLAGWYPGAVRIALEEAARWPATFAAVLAAGGSLAPQHPGPPAPRPGRGRIDPARFYGVVVLRMAAGLGDALTKVDQWNIGFADGGPRRLLADEPLEVRWLPAPRPHSFLADPFVVERDGVRALFAEDFDYARGRGVIDALVLDGERVVRRVRIIDTSTHLSYPFPLEIDGRLYLVPENCGANEVALYRCVRFPDRWERESALFPHFDGVDTTFFAHGGRWWAFCTRYSRGSTLALHALHAPALRGPWTEHPLNPIVVDVASARPAGPPFVVDGVLHRLGQDCSRTYGGAVVIARVDELTPTAYRETLLKRLAPPPGRYRDGIHTVSFAGDTLVVDGKRTVRDARMLPRGVRGIVAGRIGRLLGREAVSEPTPA